MKEDMVRQQLLPRGIHDHVVVKTMRMVDRHEFVPASVQSKSYDDGPISIGSGQTISQPLMVALMTQALELKGGERVLEIGTGSGYQTAVLAQIVHKVYTIERIAELSQRAQEILSKQKYTNIEFRIGDGTLGWPEEAPFDAIIVTAGAPTATEPLLMQLGVSGRMVIPVGDRQGQELILFHKTARGIESKVLCRCTFVPLIGDFGWEVK